MSNETCIELFSDDQQKRTTRYNFIKVINNLQLKENLFVHQLKGDYDSQYLQKCLASLLNML